MTYRLLWEYEQLFASVWPLGGRHGWLDYAMWEHDVIYCDKQE